MHDALLVDDHLASLGAAPALTAYGPEGRLEVSGRVARQWAQKIGGLLRDELDAEPGDSLTIDLPPSWRAPLWTLGALLVGVTPDLTGGGSVPGTTGTVGSLGVVTHDPTSALAGGAGVLALAAPSLAMRWPGDLPSGSLDAAAETLAQPDELVLPPSPVEDDPTLARGLDVGRGLAAGARLARVATGTAEDVPWVLGTWLARGSAVLLAPGTHAEEAARLAEVERASLEAAD
ncbi:TIGR03089 family protein [Georgenia sp. Z1491]|uniref:TIGR03089 family protein n=1 Tax=Georgenia sp. Z1491 TaxID=3416707 RepID=UPI003CF47183